MRNLSNDVYHKVVFCFILFFLYSTMSFAESSHLIVKDRVMGMNTCLDKKYTKELRRRIKLYTVNSKKSTAIILGRASIYFPIFENILREKGLPDDLKYLAVLESGLSPHATSKVGAAGLWQFMKPTGRMQGLKINSVVDERRDIIKSTYAAVDYLAYLYQKFGNWTLAIAAYNSGPGNVRKAIKRSGGKTSYWDIQKYLPRETRHYVPKYLAYMYVMNYYHEYDITPQIANYQLTRVASAKVNATTNLKKISKDMGIDYYVIKTLNAQYIKGYIPRNDGKYLLTLPEQELYAYASQKNLDVYFHPSTRIETVATKRSKIYIPSLERYFTKTRDKNEEIRNLRLSKKIHLFKYHIIKRKESLSDIARKESMTLEDLIALNHITKRNLPKIGDVIKVYTLE